MKKFSVITISYNAGEAVRKTVDSVLRQDLTDIEYLFIDGASTDNTKEIIVDCIEKLENRGISVKFISEPDKGISDAFNKGILCAEGEIIVILNAADTMMEGTLQKVQHEFDQGIDVLYGNVLFCDEKRNLNWIRKSQSEKALGKLKYSMVLQHPATYIRKSAYKEYGLYDISYRYCMDEELLYRFFISGAKFKYMDYTCTCMQAGGVSDDQVWKVLKEGTRIPLMYGDHAIKVNIIVIFKFVRHQMAHLYRRLFRRR